MEWNWPEEWSELKHSFTVQRLLMSNLINETLEGFYSKEDVNGKKGPSQQEEDQEPGNIKRRCSKVSYVEGDWFKVIDEKQKFRKTYKPILIFHLLLSIFHLSFIYFLTIFYLFSIHRLPILDKMDSCLITNPRNLRFCSPNNIQSGSFLLHNSNKLPEFIALLSHIASLSYKLWSL